MKNTLSTSLGRRSGMITLLVAVVAVLGWTASPSFAGIHHQSNTNFYFQNNNNNCWNPPQNNWWNPPQNNCWNPPPPPFCWNPPPSNCTPPPLCPVPEPSAVVAGLSVALLGFTVIRHRRKEKQD